MSKQILKSQAVAMSAAAIILACAGTAAAQPANNACANATNMTVVAGGSSSVAGTTVAATNDGGANTCGNTSTTADVWYQCTAPAAGLLTFDTCTAASFDTVIQVRAACGGAIIGCSDDACAGNRSSVSVPVTAGQTVWARVSAFNAGATGTFTMTVRHGLPPSPPNPTIGPDVTTGFIADVLRHGTGVSSDGVAVTAYSVGTTSCGSGDYPVIWVDSSAYLPDYDTTQHPVISQNMYRLKTYSEAGVNYQRFEHLGQSWLKHGFVSTNSGGCGGCAVNHDLMWRPSQQAYQDFNGDVLGINCSDTYGASLNGSFGSLGAKNIVNASLGTSPFVRNNGTGDATTKMRLQVPTADVTGQPAGTRYFVEGFYVTADDAQFVRPGQNVAVNGLNNASYRELTASTINNAAPSFAAATFSQQPGIFAWRAADAGVTLVSVDHDDTPNPTTGYKNPDGSPQRPAGTAFIRSRFWVAGKVTNLNNGTWRYEYNVYNLNSDRSAGSFAFPIPDAASVSNYTFRAPRWHSGEPYSNAAWTLNKSQNMLTFSTQPFATNANANAIRWGTMFSFGFTSSQPPTTGNATLGLFKPGASPDAPQSLSVVNLPVPTPPPSCLADFNGDGSLDPDDLSDYIGCFFTAPPCPQADFNNDGNADPDDLSDYIGAFFGGCN